MATIDGQYLSVDCMVNVQFSTKAAEEPLQKTNPSSLQKQKRITKLIMTMTKITQKIPQILTILIFASNFFLISSAAEAPSPVLDIAGEKLRAGTNYYILPVIRGRGGGLTLSSNKTCPNYVVQEQFEVRNGLPLTFTPVDPKKGVIRESTDLNVKFSGNSGSNCAESTVWKLGEDEVTSGLYVVTSGGVEGNPGPGTISNWFKIEKFGSDYKLFFCPTVCNFCKVICRDIGLSVEGGKRRLVLSLMSSEVPFGVKFKKA